MKKNIRFAGSGGQGVILASVILAKAYGLGKGYNISQTQSYGPEARGGACKAELVVSDAEIDYMKVEKADVFVAFNQSGYDKYIGRIAAGAIILVNDTLVDTEIREAGADTARRIYRLPATEIADELEVPMSVNLVMLGALSAVLEDLGGDAVRKEISKSFEGDALDINLAAFERGYHIGLGFEARREAARTPRSRVMVFVTTQKHCDRLIRFGREILSDAGHAKGGEGGELNIVHIANRRFQNFDETAGEALDYLYEYALQAGTHLTLIRSDNIAETMARLIGKNLIDAVVLGESGDRQKEPGLIDELRAKISSETALIILPT